MSDRDILMRIWWCVFAGLFLQAILALAVILVVVDQT